MQYKIVEWIVGQTDAWRWHRDDNYLELWEEYERLWRGVWSAQDKTRESERSRIISPALQQAIENHTSEIEEALFGQGDYLFDIEDDMQDQDPRDIEYTKQYMKECFKKNKLRKSVGDIVLLGSIYGTGIGELILKKTKELHPASQPIPNSDAVAIGVEEREKVSVYLKPINPKNFLIDPNASTVEEAMGCAVEEFVSAHTVAQKQKEGIYREEEVGGSAASDDRIEESSIEDHFEEDKVRIMRYYGLVPRAMLEQAMNEDEVESLFPDEEDTSSGIMDEFGDMVEAIVVIADGSVLLKAEASPYMMKDRPIVAYQDDSIPNRFWGRGVAEKGFNMQKAIDAQIRTHLDSLALTSVPMMGMDATRLPRGAKFEIKPGKNILTNGNPAEILLPFKFGNTDGSNIETASKFENMLLQATGTLDNASVNTPPEGTTISVALSSLIKRNKRTLVNIQEQFIIPFVEKAAWRFMQFDPENFPVQDFKFIPMASLGMLAREVEQVQMINLLKTLGPDTPMLPILMRGIVNNSSLPNKQEMIAMIEQSGQPSPEEQEEIELRKKAELLTFQAEMGKAESEINKNNAMTQKLVTETQLLPQESQARLIAALSTNLPDEDDKIAAEFDRRVKIAELMLSEADLDNNTKIVSMQMGKKPDAKED